jgi:hypothetical protein
VEEGVRRVSVEVLLAGALGALGVFFLGLVKDWWLRRRELNGLLRLLGTELDYNDGTLDKIHDEMVQMAGWYPIRPLARADTWEQVRTRIAELLPSDEKLQELTDYYLRLQQVNDRLDTKGSVTGLHKYGPDTVKPLQEDGQRIRQWMRNREFLRLRF